MTTGFAPEISSDWPLVTSSHTQNQRSLKGERRGTQMEMQRNIVENWRRPKRESKTCELT